MEIRKTKIVLAVGVLLVYIVILVKLIVFKYPPSMMQSGENLVPLATILPYLTGEPTWTIAIRNLVGNIVPFIPLGFLMPLFYRSLAWKRMFVVAIGSALTVEMVQMVLRVGIFDVDDILLNTLGVILGYCAFAVSMRTVKLKRVWYTWDMKRAWLISIVAATIIVGIFAVWKLYTSSLSPLSITTTTGNYGLFVDYQDNNYFSTKDANVRNIIKTYLSKEKDYSYEITDAQNYGYSLVYYYDKDAFVAAGLWDWRNQNPSGFVMHDMKTGKPISPCIIYPQAGLYKDTDLLLSVSFIDNGVSPKFGACFYERGAPNFAFIDLTPKLSATETFFSDPAGRDLKANIKDVDTQEKTFAVDVYDTTKKDGDGNYVFKRSLEVSY